MVSLSVVYNYLFYITYNLAKAILLILFYCRYTVEYCLTRRWQLQGQCLKCFSLHAAPHLFLHLLTVAIPSWIHNSFSTSEYRPWPYHFLPPFHMAESSIAMLLNISIQSGPLVISFWPRTTRDCMTDADGQPEFHFMCHVGMDLVVDTIIID